MRSSSLSGRRPRSASRIPEDSSWNTPKVGKHVVRFGVVERQRVQVDIETPGLLDQRHRVGEDGERPEAEEIHLE